MGFETYVVETINQMNLLLVRSDTHYKQRQEYLLEAAVLGCRTLKQLSGDAGFSSIVEEFADVRIIKGFLERASDDYKRRESEKVDQFRTIIENSDCFATFLDLEREVGSAVSAALGAVFIRNAAADLAKTLGAAK